MAKWVGGRQAGEEMGEAADLAAYFVVRVIIFAVGVRYRERQRSERFAACRKKDLRVHRFWT